MYKPVYILEVQRWGKKCGHVGYMDAIFKTKKDACSYYDRHNPHMRSLNAHRTWRSDWDPETRLLYVVREYGFEYLKISPFDPEDEPRVKHSRNASGKITGTTTIHSCLK